MSSVERLEATGDVPVLVGNAKEITWDIAIGLWSEGNLNRANVVGIFAWKLLESGHDSGTKSDAIGNSKNLSDQIVWIGYASVGTTALGIKVNSSGCTRVSIELVQGNFPVTTELGYWAFCAVAPPTKTPVIAL